jgi:hypothetical protein
LLLPVDSRFLSSVSKSNPPLDTNLLVQELQEAVDQAGGYRVAEQFHALCDTMWECLEEEAPSERSLVMIRRVIKHLPTFLDCCIKREGMQHGSALYRSAVGFVLGHTSLAMRLSMLSRKFVLTSEEAADAEARRDETSIMALMEFVSEFEVTEDHRDDSDGSDTDGEEPEVVEPASTENSLERRRTVEGGENEHSLESRRSDEGMDRSGSTHSNAGSSKPKKTFPPLKRPMQRVGSFRKGSSKILALAGDLKIDVPGSGRSGKTESGRPTGTTSRSSVSDETEVASSEVGSSTDPASSRTKSNTHIVPKLSINKNAQAAHAPDVLPSGGRSTMTGLSGRGAQGGGNPAAAVASPYTTRSSRRHNQSRLSIVSNPHVSSSCRASAPPVLTDWGTQPPSICPSHSACGPCRASRCRTRVDPTLSPPGASLWSR